jgi:hypothetical protein
MARGRRKAAAKPPTPPPEDEEEEEVAAEEEEMEVDVPPPPVHNEEVRPAAARPSSSSSPARRPSSTINNDAGEDHFDEEVEEDEDADASTLKVLLSTDNHLGYLERDPIRGRDSFAAFEEVLSLARRHEVDMVLLSGDLFHENKPSRKTMHTVRESSVLFCALF